MRKNEKIKKESYKDYWMKKGEYGINRVNRMMRRKQRRHDKAVSRRRSGIRWIDGVAYQVCDYQPNFSGESLCRYPCNGDC